MKDPSNFSERSDFSSSGPKLLPDLLGAVHVLKHMQIQLINHSHWELVHLTERFERFQKNFLRAEKRMSPVFKSQQLLVRFELIPGKQFYEMVRRPIARPFGQ